MKNAPQLGAADLVAPRDADSETLHTVLRRDTAPLHRAVEAALDCYKLVELEGYRGFLVAQARAVLPIERFLDQAGVMQILPDWPDRRRSQSLGQDLHRLGEGLPREAPHKLMLDTPGRQIGALYVLEGSRLGGRLLAQKVAEGGEPALGEATRFLRHSAGPGKWKEFLAILNASASEKDDILDGARQAFGLFLAAANAPSDHPAAVGHS